MTPQQLWGWIMLAMILTVVLGGAWEIFRGVRWLVRKTRASWEWHRLIKQYKRLDRIAGQDGG